MWFDSCSDELVSIFLGPLEFSSIGVTALSRVYIPPPYSFAPGDTCLPGVPIVQDSAGRSFCTMPSSFSTTAVGQAFLLQPQDSSGNLLFPPTTFFISGNMTVSPSLGLN